VESFWRRVGERKKMSNEDREMCRRADDESSTVGGVLPSVEVCTVQREEGRLADEVETKQGAYLPARSACCRCRCRKTRATAEKGLE
jgi:hypothetical protein